MSRWSRRSPPSRLASPPRPRPASQRPTRREFALPLLPVYARAELTGALLPCISLSATRKKRKPAEGYATPAVVKTYVQNTTVPSLHGTKPPGISSLDLAKGGELFVTGG